MEYWSIGVLEKVATAISIFRGFFPFLQYSITPISNL
jgi:hypothetical protein